MLAGEPQFAAHMAPVYEALPAEHRGDWLTAAPAMLPTLRHMGYQPHMLRAGAGPLLVASVSDLNRARRTKCMRVAYMEHGVGQSYAGDPRTANHGSYAGGPGREHCALIMAPNELAAERWRAAYPQVPVHVIGATHKLPAPLTSEPLLCVSFHWNGGMPEMRNAFTHYHHSLAELARELPVIGHGHPRMAGALKTRYAKAGIRWVPRLQDVARAATVYAVDNSSTLYELARTRPVIAMNAPEWRRDVHHGLRFWSHVPGPMVDDGEGLLETARRLLYEGESEAERLHRERVLADVFPPLDGAVEASTLLVRWLTGSE